MTTIYPPDPCAPPVAVNDIPPAHINLMRETLPYLKAVELSPSTSVVLRALIADIQFVTEGKP